MKYAAALKMGMLLILAASASSATTIAFSDSQSTDFAPSTLSFSLQQFNPSWGTLVSVTLQYSASLDGSLQVQNGGSGNGALSGSVQGNFTLNGPGGLGTLLSLNPVTSLGPQTVNGFSTLTLGMLSATDSNSTVLTSPADLSLFIGTGLLALAGNATVNIAPHLNFTPSILNAILNGSANVTVIYEFDALNTPEPSTLAALASGLALLAYRFRRR